MAMNEVNIVIHAAALKQVPAAEYNQWNAQNKYNGCSKCYQCGDSV